MAKKDSVEVATVNLIGKGTVIKGDIVSNGDLRIDGNVSGSIQSTGKVVVGQTGIVEGEITCQNAELEGEIKAIIAVKGLLNLKQTARFTGDITTVKLAVEPGALFTGTCKMERSIAEVKPT
ncbi:MAG TPA: polymer-forming cytoskeletal protein [Bacteroidales bacterium]|nr:polymer-forming cytoskeletal protein [Bacteroidales bacterium]